MLYWPETGYVFLTEDRSPGRLFVVDAGDLSHEERGATPGDLIETDWMDMFIVRDMDGHQIVFAETDESRHSVDPW